MIVVGLDKDIMLKIVKRLEASGNEECAALNDVETSLHWLYAFATIYRIMMDNPTACKSLDNLNLCIEDVKKALDFLLNAAFLDLRLRVEAAEVKA